MTAPRSEPCGVVRWVGRGSRQTLEPWPDHGLPPITALDHLHPPPRQAIGREKVLTPEPQAASYLSMRLACRSRMLRTAPRPVPVGGLRMPSSKSFSTTALL